jgi:hypothetical protein
MFIEVSADPVETLLNLAQVNAMIDEINESCRVQARVNGGSNLFTIGNGAMENQPREYQGRQRL